MPIHNSLLVLFSLVQYVKFLLSVYLLSAGTMTFPVRKAFKTIIK
jgi:hypothetical protein